MFIDLCYANGNEKEFLEVAKRVATLNMCFLGGKVSFNFNSGKTPKFFDFESVIQKNSVCIIQNLKKDRKFNAPMKINHVYIKELKENDCIVGVSFNHALKNPLNFEKIKFIVKLCKKYKVPVLIGSFARNPYEIRAKQELLSFSKSLLLDKEVLENFSNFLAQDI